MSVVPVAGSTPARIARTWDETPWLRGLALEAPPELVADHRLPGQYVKLEHEAGKGYFALANAPGDGLELLVKRGAPLADALIALPPGEAVSISGPTGQGYPIHDHSGHDVLLFAAGSGIAPLRGVIRHILPRRNDFGAVHLYYGQR